MATSESRFEAAGSAVGAVVNIAVLLAVATIILALGALAVGATAGLVGPANALGIWLVVGVMMGIWLLRA